MSRWTKSTSNIIRSTLLALTGLCVTESTRSLSETLLHADSISQLLHIRFESLVSPQPKGAVRGYIHAKFMLKKAASDDLTKVMVSKLLFARLDIFFVSPVFRWFSVWKIPEDQQLQAQVYISQCTEVLPCDWLIGCYSSNMQLNRCAQDICWMSSSLPSYCSFLCWALWISWVIQWSKPFLHHLGAKLLFLLLLKADQFAVVS